MAAEAQPLPEQAQQRPIAPETKFRIGLAFALLLGIVLYLPAIWFDFVDDDTLQIVRNPLLRSFSFVPQYFGNAWSHSTLRPGMPMMPYYRPVFLVWLAANYQLFGPSTAAYHATSILLHACTLWLLYLVIRKVSDSRAVALLTTVLFAVHPVHIEAVSWVSGATESLVALPLLASFLCYLNWSQGRDGARQPWLYGSLAFYAVAVFSKETALVFPAILAAYNWLFDRRPHRTVWQRANAAIQPLAPYAVVLAVYSGARAFSGADVNAHHSTASTLTLLLSVPKVVAFYFSHLLWPFGLSTVYDLRYVNGLTFRGVFLPAAAVLIMAAAVWMAARRSPLVAFGAVWFAVLIAPPLYLRALPPAEIAHDRYLYLPSVGFCLLLALAFKYLFEHRISRVIAYVGFTGVTALWAAGLVAQNQLWANDVLLFGHAYQVAPGNPRALWQYSLYLARNDRCGEAVPLLNESLKQKPDVDTQYALGVCYFKLGLPDAAESALKAAIASTRDFQEPYILLAIMQLQQRRFVEAEAILAQADRTRVHGIEPPGLHLVRGEILAARGEWARAAEHFRKEIAYEPPLFREAAELDLKEVELKLQ